MKVSRRALIGAGTLHVRKSRDRQWYWVAIARNGEPMATSETYTRKYDAKRAANRFRTLIALSPIVVDDDA